MCAAKREKNLDQLCPVTVTLDFTPVQLPSEPARAAKPQHVMDDDGTIERRQSKKKKGTNRIDKALTANKAYE